MLQSAYNAKHYSKWAHKASPWDRGYDCPHFRDKKTKAQEG